MKIIKSIGLACLLSLILLSSGCMAVSATGKVASTTVGVATDII